MRLVIEVKNGINPDALADELYRLTKLEDSFAINSVALVDGQPSTLSLKQMLEVYLAHRLQVIRRRTSFLLGQGARPAAPGGGPAARDRRHRRRDRHHPLLRGLDAGPDATDGRLRAQRDPGHLHPRHAAAPAHQDVHDRAGVRARQAVADDRRPVRDPRVRRAAARGDRDRARRGRADPRHAAAHDPAGLRRRPGDCRARTQGRRRPRDRRRPVLGDAVLHRPAGPHRQRRAAADLRPARDARRDRLRRPRHGPRGVLRPHQPGTAAARPGHRRAVGAGHRCRAEPAGRVAGGGAAAPAAGRADPRPRDAGRRAPSAGRSAPSAAW